MRGGTGDPHDARSGLTSQPVLLNKVEVRMARTPRRGDCAQQPMFDQKVVPVGRSPTRGGGRQRSARVTVIPGETAAGRAAPTSEIRSILRTGRVGLAPHRRNDDQMQNDHPFYTPLCDPPERALGQPHRERLLRAHGAPDHDDIDRTTTELEEWTRDGRLCRGNARAVLDA